MQLIKIKQIPIDYEIKTENAKLVAPQIEPAELDLETTPLTIENETTPIKLRMDSSDMRRSMGMKTIADVHREYPAQTQATANRVTSKYVSLGNKMANGHSSGITVAQLMKEDLMSKSAPIETTIAQIPSERIDISWEPATVKHKVKRSEVSTNWKKAAQEMEFVPSQYSLEIKEYARVEIEYIGGFQYVPPSSDPKKQNE